MCSSGPSWTAVEQCHEHFVRTLPSDCETIDEIRADVHFLSTEQREREWEGEGGGRRSYLLSHRSSQVIPTCLDRELFFVKNALTFGRTELSQIVQLFVQAIVIGRVVMQMLIQQLREREMQRRKEGTDLTRSSFSSSSMR